jgi:hypothetical protein
MRELRGDRTDSRFQRITVPQIDRRSRDFPPRFRDLGVALGLEGAEPPLGLEPQVILALAERRRGARERGRVPDVQFHRPVEDGLLRGIGGAGEIGDPGCETSRDPAERHLQSGGFAFDAAEVG